MPWAVAPGMRMPREVLVIKSEDARRGSHLPLSFAGPVIGARSQEPDPISNSAVKLLSADGTVSQDPGE